jgi:hypothetical protein
MATMTSWRIVPTYSITTRAVAARPSLYDGMEHKVKKAEQGIWPTKTPLGYRNVAGPDGKRIIATDPDVAPIVSKLFEWYATGQYSLQEAARKARDTGLV